MLAALRIPLSVRSDSPPATETTSRFPRAWLAAAPFAAALWTAAALTQNNLEMQSIDLVHHSMFVDHLQTPWGIADRAFVGPYPLLSHRVAAIFMPVFHNPIMAVRAAALTSLLVMLIAQWRLLRTRLSPSMAMLALFGWQALCTNCKLGDANHFLWEWQYNYSRAIAAAALWLILLAFLTPPSRHRIINLVFLLGLGAFAFGCHLAAGSLALAALGAGFLVHLLKRDWGFGIAGLAGLSLIAAAYYFFNDDWRHMAKAAGDPAPLPIRHPDLIALWIPTAVIGVLLVLTRLRQPKWTLTTAILCGLLPAAALQGYLLYGKNVTHTISSYPYNQMLFYTFGLASLLWVNALGGMLQIVDLTFPRSIWLASVIAFFGGLFILLEADARRSRVDPARDPVIVAEKLKPLRDQFFGHYYYDPDLEHASYFVTRVVLGAGGGKAADYRNRFHHRQPEAVFRDPDLRGVFLPLAVNPHTLFGPACPAEAVGDFWKCNLEIWRWSREASP